MEKCAICSLPFIFCHLYLICHLYWWVNLGLFFNLVCVCHLYSLILPLYFFLVERGVIITTHHSTEFVLGSKQNHILCQRSFFGSHENQAVEAGSHENHYAPKNWHIPKMLDHDGTVHYQLLRHKQIWIYGNNTAMNNTSNDALSAGMLFVRVSVTQDDVDVVKSAHTNSCTF